MKRIIYVSILLFFHFSFSQLSAQEQVSKTDTGTVNIIKSADISQLLEKNLYVSKKTNGKSAGYRVQIHFGGDSKEAKEIKAEFMTKHPELATYFTYEQPNFKVRVGDFKTKLEAQNLLRTLRADYPSAFVVEDEVEMMSIK